MTALSMVRSGRGGWLLTLPLAVFVIAVVLPLATFSVATWLGGGRLQPVLSASMAPTYGVGSLLVVAPLDASDVQPGMVISFDDPSGPGRLVTHRVLRAAPAESLAFITQGDANVTPDPFPVPARNVRGQVLWSVPVLGHVFDALRWPVGFLLLVVAPALLLVGGEVAGRRRATGPGHRLTPVAGEG